jgi:hypothetical protein
VPGGEPPPKLIEIAMIPAMHRPTVAKDKCLQFNERVRTAFSNWSVVQYILKLHNALQSTRQVKESVTVVSAFLINSCPILLKLGPDSPSKNTIPVVRKPIPAADLFVD